MNNSILLLKKDVDLRIPLIDELTVDPVPVGSALMVEFDPTSQWYAASMAIAAGWLRTGGTVTYSVNAQPPDSVRTQFRRLGLDVPALEKDERLVIFDGYTVTLGRKSNEKYAAQSLKAADLSITYSREVMQAGPVPELLTIVDNVSTLARFNDERAWIEFLLTRGIPSAFLTKSTTIAGIITGVHPDSVYKQLEAAADGVIDLKLDAASDPPRNLIRIRSMRNIRFDGRWREIKPGENFDITLKPQSTTGRSLYIVRIIFLNTNLLKFFRVRPEFVRFAHFRCSKLMLARRGEHASLPPQRVCALPFAGQ